MNDEKEKRFLDALGALFTGARVEGDSGFINLMRVKNRYFEQIRPELMKKFNEAAPFGGEFREELFDKLHAFFSRYFCESGSVYFRRIPAFYPAREEVYADGGDMELVWKTRDLYYVKSDYLISSMPVEWTMQGCVFRFYFDASGLEARQNNERRNFVFSFADVRTKKDADGREERCTELRVSFSARGNKTNTDDILKKMRAAGAFVEAEEENLERAFAIFRRQTEADFFIHKNARAFLRGQFDMWMYQYIFREESDFGAARIAQLHGLRDCAHSLINFIGQFEDELVRIWQKPKIARDVNYVLTADKLTAEVLQKAAAHSGAAAQAAEWRELRLVGEDFGFADMLRDGAPKFLPLDTRHFKDLEGEMLECLGDLDSALDGEMIRGDNWQALNTLRAKYAGRVKCVYIDPPYNTLKDKTFEYLDEFQSSTWLTFMAGRISLIRDFMHESGCFYMQLDHYADYLGRMLLQRAFPQVSDEDQTVITWNTGDNISGYKTQRDNWIRQADKILCFPKNPELMNFYKLWTPLQANKQGRIGWLDFIGEENGELYIEKWERGKLVRKPVSVKAKRIGTVWNDIYSFQYSEPRESESFSFKTQKPENLLRRIIQSSSLAGDIVLDCFGGTGTTAAVAHKLGRKWLTVEQERYFSDFYCDSNGVRKMGILGRMKIVLSGDKNFHLPNTSETRRPHLSKDLNWEGGGAFKYYALEQYEETLKKMHYKDGELLDAARSKTPFEQYVFLADDKFAHAVSAGKGKNGKIKINLSALYADADLPETLANLIGSPLRRRTPDFAEFANGKKIPTNPAKMTEEEKITLLHLLRPVLWWGE